MADSQAEWTLYYWPGIKGRGEPVRLMFEDAQVPYFDVANKEGFESVLEFFYKGGQKEGFPALFAPAIKRGDFVICNSPAIMDYLGKEFGMRPATLEDEGHVNQILAIVTDAIADGRLAYHPKNFYTTHKDQVEESKPYIEQYKKERLPKYVGYLEKVLAHNQNGEGFVVGTSITAADFAVFHYLQALQHHMKDAFDACDAKLCKTFMERMAARPNIKVYQASDRCPPFDKDSLM